MADKDLPELESADEAVLEGADEMSSAVPPQPGSSGAAATPSNTPVVNLFPKASSGATGTKRGFEGAAAPGADVADMLSKLAVASKKGPSKADPEDDDDDRDDDEDEDYEDEEEEEEYVAVAEQREAIVPLLLENQEKLNQIQEEYRKARRDLEVKFEKDRAPLYKERAQIVRGNDENEGPALPGFWSDALNRSWIMRQCIEEYDEPVLIFLNDITSETLTNEFGYRLDFHFAKNPFFSNEVLSKTIKLSNMYQADTFTPDIEESVGTEIDWFEDKNVTVEVVVRKIKAGKKGKKGSTQTKEIKQEVPRQSFFNFFESRKELTDEEMQALSEEEQQDYHRGWEIDFAISSTLRSKIIPQVALWYSGEVEDSDDEYDDDEEEEEEEDDEDFDELDEEDDEDDEDDDDEDEPPRKGGKKGKGGNKPTGTAGTFGAAGATEGNPECKQQ